MFETLKFEVTKGGVAGIVLNRPERGNALNHPMRAELVACLKQVADNPDIRVVVLKGEGKHFCSGADFGGGSACKDGEPVIELPEIFDALEKLPKPTLAIVHGAAVGAGAALAVCCDIVIATDTGFFALPEVRIGRPLGSPLPYMVRAMGERAARRYLLTGERISGAKAVELGLVHECCAASDLEGVRDNIVDALLLGAPQAQATSKAALLSISIAGGAEMDDVVRLARAGLDQREAKEGVAAFKEKRKPYWYK